MTTTDNPQLQDATTRIAGITVELEFYHEHGEVVSSCFLSVENQHGRYQGSLGLCEDRGAIPHDQCSGDPDNDSAPEFYPLTDKQLSDIREWAEARGY